MTDPAPGEKRPREDVEDEDDDSSSDFGPAPAVEGGDSGGGGVKRVSKKVRVDVRGKKRVLEALPDQASYERSYMHKDIVHCVFVAKKEGYVLTGSVEGVLKFWKKAPVDVIPVKTFRPHMGIFEGAMSCDEQWFATRAETADRAIKIFEVSNFDMINIIQIDYASSTLAFLHQPEMATMGLLAVCEATKPIVHFYNPESTTELHSLTISCHRPTSTIKFLKYNPLYHLALSIDDMGLIEYWDPATGALPKDNPLLGFKSKMDTDLFKLAKDRAKATSLELSPNCEYFSIMGSNSLAYVYAFKTGKQYRVYDESLGHYTEQQQNGPAEFRLEQFDFGKRLAMEKEMGGKAGSVVRVNIIFDDSSHFIIYSCMLGVKVVNLRTNKVERILGKFENSERFTNIGMFQGRVEATQQLQQHLGAQVVEQAKHSDPTVFTAAWRRERFYLLTRRGPGQEKSSTSTTRDVLNEKPSAEDVALLNTAESSVGTKVVLHTTMGDVHIQLFPKEVPKTTENFVGHCRSGYYDNLTFHRVIDGFMVQTGCPYGDGTGGESIWGGEFADEFHPALRHDRPFTVSMANAGADNNGSQFFITTVVTKWLDDKHTVFGRVTKGMDVVQAIEKVKTHRGGPNKDRPMAPVKIISTEVH